MPVISEVKARAGRPPNGQRKNAKVYIKTRSSKRLSGNANGEESNQIVESQSEEALQQANSNLSNEKKKRDPLLKLKTDLSPKFIAFASSPVNKSANKTTPRTSRARNPEKLNNSTEVNTMDKTPNSYSDEESPKMKKIGDIKVNSTEENNNSEKLPAVVDLETVIPSNIIMESFSETEEKNSVYSDQNANSMIYANLYDDGIALDKYQTEDSNEMWKPESKKNDIEQNKKHIEHKSQYKDKARGSTAETSDAVTSPRNVENLPTINADENELADFCLVSGNEECVPFETEGLTNLEMLEELSPLSYIEYSPNTKTTLLTKTKATKKATTRARKKAATTKATKKAATTKSTKTTTTNLDSENNEFTNASSILENKDKDVGMLEAVIPNIEKNPIVYPSLEIQDQHSNFKKGNSEHFNSSVEFDIEGNEEVVNSFIDIQDQHNNSKNITSDLLNPSVEFDNESNEEKEVGATLIDIQILQHNLKKKNSDHDNLSTECEDIMDIERNFLEKDKVASSEANFKSSSNKNKQQRDGLEEDVPIMPAIKPDVFTLYGKNKTVIGDPGYSLFNFQNLDNLDAADGTSEINAPSPSLVSIDSAKFSSIDTDTSWSPYSTGDLFWGQIYTYSYWPCMVCPDPNGETMLSGEIGHEVEQVHVRFFADNARRNWVRVENLIRFNGLEKYQEHAQEIIDKYGPRNPKCKFIMPKQNKKRSWLTAISEANKVNEVAYPDRLEKFYDIFEKTRTVLLFERKRRKSMEDDSALGSMDEISNKQTSPILITKRERDSSISPFSPAYSPIKPMGSKRRRLNSVQEEMSKGALSLASAETTLQLADTEFNTFLEIMTEFVMEQHEPEHNEELKGQLLMAVCAIWNLKKHGTRKMLMNTNELGSTYVESSNSLKRLSNRIKNTHFLSTFKREPGSIVQKPMLNTSEKLKPRFMNRPIEEVINDIFNLDSKYLFRGLGREAVCKYCYQPGTNLMKCSKSCQSWLHFECNVPSSKRNMNKKTNTRRTKVKQDDSVFATPSTSVELNELNAFSEILVKQPQHITAESNVVCLECSVNAGAKCIVCNRGKESDQLIFCSTSHCSQAFHPKCCKYWPQSKITMSMNTIESFRCPSHVCHTCVSDDPKRKFQYLKSTKMTRCIKCPASYHTDSTCIPAGTQILTAAYIICPRHSQITGQHVNANWCFICVGGGKLICCETCPTAVHAECLKIPIDADEGYICEECESGRLPLYGEMVWVKFNTYRWWPAIILPPTEIPKNIERKEHGASDFVVRFFGSHDHGWTRRHRVYLYVEGDSSQPPKARSNLDGKYIQGVEEAKKYYETIKVKKQEAFANSIKEKLDPPPYTRIKSNRAVLPVRLLTDMEKVNKCGCDAHSENPCGPETNCLNRVLYNECNPKVCLAGERCQNQMFESKVSPHLDVVHMKERGFGLLCREAISAGTFIIEYVGEVINDAEFRRRMTQKSIDRDENFYFLTVEKDYIIDAGPKGNLARFMNHSCEPNCVTQKWLVNGLNRVGLFAIKDIDANTELTFNYHWDELLGSEKKACLCGAIKCAGQIGGKYKEESNKNERLWSKPKVKAAPKPKAKNLLQN